MVHDLIGVHDCQTRVITELRFQSKQNQKHNWATFQREEEEKWTTKAKTRLYPKEARDTKGNQKGEGRRPLVGQDPNSDKDQLYTVNGILENRNLVELCLTHFAPSQSSTGTTKSPFDRFSAKMTGRRALKCRLLGSENRRGSCSLLVVSGKAGLSLLMTKENIRGRASQQSGEFRKD